MRITNSRLTVFITLLVLYCPPTLADLKDAQIAFKSGNWKVLRSTDPMKDTINCTGVYKDNYGVQLASDSLYVSVRGGIEGVRLRFGDKPARPLRLAEQMEKKIRSIIISDADFSELIENNRLRVEASTLVNGVENEDFDISGIKDALENIRAGCPIQTSVAPKENIEKISAPIPEKSTEQTCSDVVVSRMKAHGLKEKLIRAICK